MDIINSIPQIATTQPKAAPKADIPLPKLTTGTGVSLPAPKLDSVTKDLERARTERVAAALDSIKNSFAVSDSRFTLFKDSTGDMRYQSNLTPRWFCELFPRKNHVRTSRRKTCKIRRNSR